MVRDVARGLQFLAEHKYVHRDLASRNCLVNVYKTVKLGDFGMTRLVYENNCYKFCRKGMLPVRWMAPESLMQGIYTSMSDMWSYGVVLYEVITFGAFPYQTMNNDQVFEYVKSHNTLTPPPDINPLLEIMLRQCWQFSPSRRPTALQVVNTLNSNPELVSPSLDSPQICVQGETGNTALLQPPLPPALTKPVLTSTSLTRRLSLHPQRHYSGGSNALHYSRQSSLSSVSSHNQTGKNGSDGSSGSAAGGIPGNKSFISNGRKRSMSGNMAVPPITCSLSDSTIGVHNSSHHHTTLDALNLSVSAVVMEERSEDGEQQCCSTSDERGPDRVADDGCQASGDSSGYASAGTGTGGSNTSSKCTEQQPVHPGPANCVNNPNRANMLGCIGNVQTPVKSAVLGRRTASTPYAQDAHRVEACILNNPHHNYYSSDPDRTCFENQDDGAMPLLPRVRYTCDARDSSSGGMKVFTAKIRTPPPTSGERPELRQQLCPADCSDVPASDKCSCNSSGSSSTTSVAISNA